MENFIATFWIRIGVLTILGIVGLLAAFCAVYGWDILVAHCKRYRVIVASIFVGISLLAGGKHGAPAIEYPRGISDNGSMFDTNAWAFVDFKWKLVAGYPVATPIEIEAALGGGSTTNFSKIADAIAGDFSNRVYAVSFATESITNYIYRFKSDYVPGVVVITDLMAIAQKNVRAVTCSWTCPTNIVGLAGIVQAQRNIVGAPWQNKQIVVLARTNLVTVSGNFVSRGIDWNFRVLVPGFEPITLTNLTALQTGGNE